jgi:hypothetical protein
VLIDLLRHELIDNPEQVAFLMVGTNATNLEKSLDGIRERRQKFICLNDNMNHSDPEAVKVSDRSNKLFGLMLLLGCEGHEGLL